MGQANLIPAVSGAYSQLRSADLAFERNDCGVRALATAAALSYAEAHALCKHAGRPDKRGMTNLSMNHATRAAAPDTCLIWAYPCHGRITLARLLASGELDKGAFVLLVTGHYIAVVDGVVHNYAGIGRSKQVLFAWKLA